MLSLSGGLLQGGGEAAFAEEVIPRRTTVAAAGVGAVLQGLQYRERHWFLAPFALAEDILLAVRAHEVNLYLLMRGRVRAPPAAQLGDEERQHALCILLQEIAAADLLEDSPHVRAVVGLDEALPHDLPGIRLQQRLVAKHIAVPKAEQMIRYAIERAP